MLSEDLCSVAVTEASVCVQNSQGAFRCILWAETSNGCAVLCGGLRWVFRSLRTFVLVYHLQTDFSDGCFVLAEDSCFSVPFADGLLRWVFRSRGGLLLWCTLCRQMGVSSR